jgi:predicted RNA-binding protein YlxR (DUF448 family)
MKSRDQLFRFVRLKDQGKIVKNPEGNLPGKGLYICRDKNCWDRLWSRRNLKRTIASRLDTDSVEWVEKSLGGKG